MRGEREYFYPTESDIGKNCRFWSQEGGCIFPKKEMEGGRNGRCPKSLTSDQILELRTRVPNSPLNIPPGDTQV